MEVIILAGGQGTRLKSLVSDVPKPMAPVHNMPFLAYIFMWLKRFKITKVILSTGYKAEAVNTYFGYNFNGVQVEYSFEKEPLGTGGGIIKALSNSTAGNVAVVNGDTWFPIDLEVLFYHHLSYNAGITMALKHIKDSDRYGSVSINKNNSIVKFHEKKYLGEGIINGGIYIINKSFILEMDLPEKCSFEKDVLEKIAGTDDLKGVVFNDAFLDIGIPEDYLKAEQIL